MFGRVGIIGVGLMGGSFSLAYKKRFPSSWIVGFARNKNSYRRLKRLKIVDEVTDDLKKLVRESELVVLALPVKKIEEYLLKIEPFVQKKTIVIDLGSTKKNIEEVAQGLSYSKNFVGCHPLCGSEKSGAEFATSDLYKNKICIITSSLRKDSTRKIRKMWHSLQTKTIFINPSLHDEMMAYLSHFPHLVSFSLVKVTPSRFFSFPLRSFAELTRTAKANIYLWSDIFLVNRNNLVKVIDQFIAILEKFKKNLKENDAEAVFKLLKEISKKASLLR